MLISVIMATYNCKLDELKLATDSILTQSFSDIEFIICDDGSDNGTFEELSLIAKKDERILLLRHERNLKSGAARNTCLSYATGKYIAIMDSDDYSSPDRLMAQKDFLDKNPTFSFVGTRGSYFENSVDEKNGYYWFVKRPSKSDFLSTLPFVHASLMFRREVLLEVGGYSNKSLFVRSEDYELIMRLYGKNMYGANLDVPLYQIRQNTRTYDRRKYQFRINEAIVKFRGFKKMGLMPKGLVYAIKPLIVGLIPIRVLNSMKRKYYREQ